MAFHRILVAFDGSEQSVTAYAQANKLCKELKAQLAVVNVLDPEFAIENPDAGMVRAVIINEMRENQKTMLSSLIPEKPATPPTLFSAEGNPHEEILKAAESWNADLIIIGTHGRTGLARLLMGSVAEQVLRHSKIPVLTYPHPER
ncbi:MAG: universal stress protein [Leptospiraceae bacterium]|nr:universal stress protein [Leptospiraceae bacterium]